MIIIMLIIIQVHTFCSPRRSYAFKLLLFDFFDQVLSLIFLLQKNELFLVEVSLLLEK